MLYRRNLNCIYAVAHTTRYDYAYSEVRGESVCNGAQAVDEDCEVRTIAGQDYPESQHSSCSGQDWKRLSFERSRKRHR
jgi:hypothetical protein